MLPAALLALLGAHLYLVVRQGISAAPRRED
jgi:quinol-cytochrome oxidoreductase complex cytochrome b subunit